MVTVKHKGYEGSVEIDLERNVCRGKILFINDLVTYEAADIKSIQKEFEAAVDDYLETCEQLGRSPSKSYKGSFNVRISPDVHRQAAMTAYRHGLSLNDYVGKAILNELKGAHANPVI